jgi:hypothetical protein
MTLLMLLITRMTLLLPGFLLLIINTLVVADYNTNDN